MIFSLFVLTFPCQAQEAYTNVFDADTRIAETSIATMNHLPENLNRVRYYGNGTCMPYARHRSGIEIYGWASTILGRLPENTSTSTQPEIGAVVVTNEGPYKHVAVVEEVSSFTIVVSEQNYLGVFVVSQRILNIDDPVIISYIIKNKI